MTVLGAPELLAAYAVDGGLLALHAAAA